MQSSAPLSFPRAVSRLPASLARPAISARRPFAARGDGTLGLRLALALVYVWFGLPKLQAGRSPAEELVCATLAWFDPGWCVPTLGLVEVAIGLSLLSRRTLLPGLALVALHLAGTALPLFLLPETTWRAFLVPTLEGQYVIKNVVLAAAAASVARIALGSACGARTGRPTERRAPTGRAPFRTSISDLETGKP